MSDRYSSLIHTPVGQLLARQLGLTTKNKRFDAKTLKIENIRPIIYRYVAARRAIVEQPSRIGFYDTRKVSVVS